MSKCRLLMTIVAIIFAQALSAYELYFTSNDSFAINLTGWLTADPNFTFPHSRGTAEWSSQHGGSAHMSISGTPGNIELVTGIGTTVNPGDTILMHLTKTNTQGFGQFDICIGWGSPFGTYVSAPGPAGEYDVYIVSERFYMPGTLLGVFSAVWPGSAEAWIHYVKLGRNSSPNEPPSFMSENVSPKIELDGQSLHGTALPSISAGDVSFLVNLPTDLSASVKIFNVAGSLVRELMVAGHRGENLIRWDGMDGRQRKAPSGMYCYEVITETGLAGYGKVVVKR